jgi:hypothetical protein
VVTVPDPLLLRESGSAGNRSWTSGSVARNSDHRGGSLGNHIYIKRIHLGTKPGFVSHSTKIPNLSARLVFPSFAHSTIIVVELQLLVR